MVDKEWSPDDEEDPAKLARELLQRAKKQADEEDARRAEYANRPPIAARPYKPPTFEEVSAVLQKAWAEVERIMPTAQDRTKAIAFQTLMQAAAPPPWVGE